MSSWPHRLAVVVPTPAHSSISASLTYGSELPLAAGTLVRVPLGKREVLGIVWGDASGEPVPPGGEKPVAGVLDGLPPLGEPWRRLVAFAAGYYQRGIGEVALAAVPPQLRELSPEQWQRRLRRSAGADAGEAAAATAPD